MDQDKGVSRGKNLLYFYHDPMCSWCWGYRPVSDQIFSALPDDITLTKIVGGLAPDSDAPMAPDMLEKLPKIWEKIHTLLGTEFNFDFWTHCTPRRSTYPACRAVLAAGRQGYEDEMTDAIQRAYYLRAMNPSDVETLRLLAEELCLNGDQFNADMESAETNDLLLEQVDFARRSPIDGFPSLAMEVSGKLVSVVRDYQNPQPTLDHIRQLAEAG